MRTAAITATLVLLSGVFGTAQAQTPVAGTDYTEISNGRPLDPPPAGVIVVEEYFNYICPACNAPRDGDVRYCEECGHDYGGKTAP